MSADSASQTRSAPIARYMAARINGGGSEKNTEVRRWAVAGDSCNLCEPGVSDLILQRSWELRMARPGGYNEAL